MRLIIFVDVPISTHAPRAGSDGHDHGAYGRGAGFQPTLPVRGATGQALCAMCHNRFQPTLPVRGATVDTDIDLLIFDISTHAPRAGSD